MAKVKKSKRFVTILQESTLTGKNKILVDKNTGVTYYYHGVSYGGGLTPLLDENGKPVITHIKNEDWE